MPTSRAGICNEEGFTLIELAFVVLVLGIVFALAFPRIMSPLLSDPLRASSESLAETIRRLRNHAVANGRSIRLRLRLPQGKWKIEAINAEGKWRELVDSPVAEGQIPDGIRLRKASMAGGKEIVEGEAALRFLPTGETDRWSLYLVDAEGSERTLAVHPFMNRVAIHPGRITTNVP